VGEHRVRRFAHPNESACGVFKGFSFASGGLQLKMTSHLEGVKNGWSLKDRITSPFRSSPRREH